VTAEYDRENPKPPATAPATEVFDWHYYRSLSDGIDPEDAEVLAHGFVQRYLR
jgi:hypothetical protein